MLRTLLTFLIAVAAAYLAMSLLLFAFQRSLMYFPQPKALAGAGSTMQLKVDDAELVVSVMARIGEKAVIYFGGNAEDVSQSLPGIAQAFPEHSVFMLHYRGFGGSTGKPTEAAIHRDAAVLLARVRSTFSDVTLIGRSLGSGVAIRLAAEAPVQRLVLITPYDSILNIAAAAYPLFPVSALLLDRYESVLHAPRVTAPTTIVVAEHDEVIPRASSDQLARHFAPGVARTKVIAGAGHNTLQNSKEYFRALALSP